MADDRTDTLIRQLQGMLGGNRIVRGAVSSSGTIVSGAGFSVVKNGTGDYTVTFDVAFADVPACLVTAGASSGFLSAKHHAATLPSSTAFRVLVFVTNTATATDGAFHFAAVGQ